VPMKRGMTIMFVPHERKKSLSIRLSGWQVVLVVVLAGTLLLLFLVGVFAGGRAVKLIAENRSLRVENEQLRLQRAKIAQLERELTETSRLRLWMEKIIGVDGTREKNQIQAASAGEGELFSLIGGPFEARLLPELETEAKYQKRRLDFIPRGIPAKGAITAYFGEMGGKFLAPHTGIDIAAPEGSIVKTTATGVILETGTDAQLGIVVTIDHLNGYKTRYGHLKAVSCEQGDWVERGEKIGIVGETGHAEGPHVHYELWSEGEPINPLQASAVSSDSLQ